VQFLLLAPIDDPTAAGTLLSLETSGLSDVPHCSQSLDDTIDMSLGE
jgi:hypothetical protein